MKKKKVFVSGCYDMPHMGHARFLEEAAGYGEVCVISQLKIRRQNG